MTLRSTVQDTAGRQKLCQRGHALLEKEKEGWRLRYSAKDEAGGRSGGDIRLHGGTVMMRSMTGGYTLELDPGRTTALCLGEGGSRLVLDIETRRACWDLTGTDEGRIELDYAMLSAGEIVSEISLQMLLRKK